MFEPVIENECFNGVFILAYVFRQGGGMMMMIGSTKKKKEESKIQGLVDAVFSWSITDVNNKNYYSGKVCYKL